MKSITLLFSILFLVSCSNSALEQELAETKLKLEQAESLAAASAEESNTVEIYPLVHVVYFKLKPDADQAKLVEEINKLKVIEVLHELEVGSFKDLGDQRALADYQIMMSMAFKNEEDYKTYQAHELHLALKENTKSFMAGPPATYDYRRTQ